MREYEDFTLIAAAVAEDLARQNIQYVEAFFSPSGFARHGLKRQEISAAIRQGLAQVSEIGHGTRAEEDPALLDYLAEHRTPLEMCPWSNVCTGVVPAIEQHPIRRDWEHGLAVTVNTDDPKMFGNSLATEYQLLQEKLGCDRNFIRALILQGIQSSWLSEDRKQQLITRFRDDPGWLAETP